MDWPRMLRGWAENGVLPRQILEETAIAQLWLAWGQGNSRPHDPERILQSINRKRLAQGLAPIRR